MSDDVKLDWRLRSQMRGIKLLVLSLPLLLVGLIASSQLPRTTTKLLWESDPSSVFKQQKVINLTAEGREEKPVQLKAKFQTKSSRLRLAMRYEIWDQKKDLLTRRTLRLEHKGQTAGKHTLTSPLIHLPTRAKYLIRSQISVHKADRKQFESWQWQVWQDPEKPSQRILQILELFTYPALSLTILACAMVFGPRLIK